MTSSMWEHGLADKELSVDWRSCFVNAEKQAISTGSIGLNRILGTGGYTRGRLIELFGKDDVGKTTLALAASAQAQRVNGLTAYVDTEYKLSSSWMKTLGVDPHRTVLIRSSDGDAVLNRILELVKSGDFALVVLDSLASLLPAAISDSPHCGDRLGEIEHLLERYLPLIAGAAYQTDTCLLMTNQMRRDNTALFEDYTSVGGQVLKHASSVSLHLSKHTALKLNKETVLGRISTVTVQKNVLGASFGTAHIPITFARGLDHHYELLLLGQALGLISAQPPFRYREAMLGVTAIECCESLRQGNDIALELAKKISSC